MSNRKATASLSLLLTLMLCSIEVHCARQMLSGVKHGPSVKKSVTTPEETLLHITEICRHGARAPISLPTPVTWMEGLELEELTPVGFRMHYIAGKDMLLKYPSIFTGRLNSKQIYVRSTGYNRTIQSAMAHLYGIFGDFPDASLPFANGNSKLLPATKDKLFDDGSITFKNPLPVIYNPYPVHTPSHVMKDEFLKAENPFCNKTWPGHVEGYAQITKLVNNSKLLQDSLGDVYKKLKLKIPAVEKDGTDLNNGFLISDFVNSDQANAAVPLLDPKKPGDARLIDAMRKVYAMAIQSFYSNEAFLKVAVTGFMTKIREDMKKISSDFKNGTGDINTTLRYQLFSAHDSTIMSVLLASKWIDPKCLQNDFLNNKFSNTCYEYPDLASSFVYELVGRTDKAGEKSVFVRTNLNGDYIDFCKLENKLAKFDCPLDSFVEVVNSMVVEDFKNSCYLPPA